MENVKNPCRGQSRNLNKIVSQPCSNCDLNFQAGRYKIIQKGDDTMLYCYDVRTEKRPFSEYFKPREFACKDGTPIVFIDWRLVHLLEDIREYFNSPVIINSAYRTYKWNEKVNGAKESYHMHGMAADIRVKGVPCKDVALKASELLGNTGGVICYTNFVHVDVRTTKRYRKGVM